MIKKTMAENSDILVFGSVNGLITIILVDTTKVMLYGLIHNKLNSLFNQIKI